MFKILRPAFGLLMSVTVLSACGGSAESANPPEGTNEVPLPEAAAVAEPAPSSEAVQALPEVGPAQGARETVPAAKPAAKPGKAVPTPEATAPAAEPEPAPEARTVAASTTLTLALDEALSTKSNVAGDAFSAHLVADLMAPGGEILLPEGTVVRGTVTEAKKSDSPDVAGMLRLQIVDVEVDGRLIPLVADVEELQLQSEAKDSDRLSAGKVAVGAAAGALLGKVTGKSATKGAVVGAAAGAVVAIATRDGHATLPAGAQMTIRLVEPLVIR